MTIDPQTLIIDAEQLQACLGQVTLVDVRTPEEHLDCRIGGEVLIPIDELEDRAEKELKDPNADIVLYCAHGIRSFRGAILLHRMGYSRVRSLTGGIEAWLHRRR